MELYKSEQEFRDAVIAASGYYRVSPAIVEKDYFVTLILRNLKSVIPGILFKGGTSLSKCFKIIERFSEDIDLTLDASHFTQSNKRSANKSIIAVCDSLGFEIQNREEVEMHSHGNYNCYNIEYPAVFAYPGIKSHIKLEMTFIQKAYPDVIKPVTSVIGDYLAAINQSEAIVAYELEPYEIKVQSLERTFIDKVFALCDYYLSGEVIRQSRHIYDLYKLMPAIDWKNQSSLVKEVRLERAHNKACKSALPDVSVPLILDQIVGSEYFKKDYENVTAALLNENVSYDEAILSVKEIAEDSLFESRI